MSELLWSEGVWISLALSALLFFLALVKGAAPERICAGILLIMPAIDQLHHHMLGGSVLYRHVDLGHMAIDALAFCALLSVALHANRVYPLWLGAAQIIAVFAHLYRISIPDIDRFAYEGMQAMPSYVQIVAMSLGLRFHVVRRKKSGSYPSWRRSFASAPARGRSKSPAS